MPAGVVDELELVEIEVQHRVVGARLAPSTRTMLRPALELAPIEETRQRIVAREMREPRGVLPLAAHVVKDEHRPTTAPMRSRIGATL
jgi:hypothetical protein